MLGQLGSDKLEVFLVEFALQVTVHLVVVEGAVFAQRANVLDPVGTAGVKREGCLNGTSLPRTQMLGGGHWQMSEWRTQLWGKGEGVEFVL